MFRLFLLSLLISCGPSQRGAGGDLAGEPDGEGVSACPEGQQRIAGACHPSDEAGGGEEEAGADGPEGPAAIPNEPTGVGYRTLTVDGPGGRTLPVALWYPAETAERAADVSYLGVIPSDVAVVDAPVSSAVGKLPVILFSHGNQAVKEQSIFLTEALAAQGYVVASPDHVGNTFLDFDAAMSAEMFLLRPGDISAVLTHLLEELPEDDPLFAKLDADRVGVTGHSFGGYTALALAGATFQIPESVLATCRSAPDEFYCPGVLRAAEAGTPALADPRIKAALPMAPAGFVLFQDEGLGEVGIPTLLMGSIGDTITPVVTEQEPMYRAITVAKYLMVVRGGNHFSFADICKMITVMPMPELVQRAGPVCGDLALIPYELVQETVVDTSLWFFDGYLRGDGDSLEALALSETDRQFRWEVAP